jgi:phage-related holin
MSADLKQDIIAMFTDLRGIAAVGAGTLFAALNVLERYVFGDLTTVYFLLLLVGIDTALGFRLAWIERRANSKEFGRVVNKLLVYLSLLAAAYAVARMGGAGNDGWVFSGLRWLVVSFVAARECLSIIEKAARMGVTLPNYITDRLKDVRDGKQKTDSPSNDNGNA